MANIAKLLVSLGIDASDYQSGLDKATNSTTGFVDKLNGSVAPMIAGAFAAGGAAAVAFAGTSIAAAGDFEAGMLEFASVTGSSITDAGLTLDQFQSKFLELGATTAYSAAQAQQAAIELAKGGVPIIDVMNGATDATLSLAAAGGVELANAATIVAKQLGVWSSEGVVAADVANIMAQAANASTVDVEELALGMANVGGIAKVSGVTFQETATTLAMISSGFSSASDAGTSLKTFFARLQPTTADATEKMQELGLMFTNTTKIANFLSAQGIKPLGDDLDTLGNQFTEWATAQGWSVKEIGKAWDQFGQSKFYDAEGNFIGMQAAADLLQGSLAGLSETEKTMALQTIFGSDALRAAALIAENGAAGFNKTTEAMNAAGTAADQAAARNQGFKFALDSLFGSIETFQIIVGGALLPVITAFINEGLIPAVNNLTTFAGAFVTSQQPINALIGLLTTGQISMSDWVILVNMLSGIVGADMAVAFVKAGEAIGELVAGAKPLVDLIGGNLQPILVGLAVVIGGIVVSAIWSMIAAVLAVAAPIAAAIAVVAVLYSAYQNNWFGIRDLVNGVVGAITSIINSFLSWAVPFWAENGAQMTVDAQITWGTIQTLISTITGAITAIVGFFAASIAQYFKDHGEEITMFTKAAWNTVNEIIRTTATIIAAVIAGLTTILTGDWRAFGDGLKIATSAFMQAIVNAIQNKINEIPAAFKWGMDQVESAIRLTIGKTPGLGRDIIDGIIRGVRSGVGALADAVKSAAQNALDAAKSALGIKSPSRVAAAEIGVPFVQGIETGIDGMLGSLGRTAGAAAGVLAGAVDTSAPAWAPADVTGEAASLYNTPSGPQYNITAQYAKYQDERTLRDDIRMYSLLNAPNAG